MSGNIFRGSYENLTVWKKAFALSLETYALTKEFPDEERYGLTSQMRRASVSIPSNIAEGYGRNSKKHFKQFLRIAYGSTLELQTQIRIAKNLDTIKHLDYTEIDHTLDEVLKLLYVMIREKDSS